MFKKVFFVLILFIIGFPLVSFSAENRVNGKITSLMGSANDPAIRMTGNETPTQCDGGTYGWLYFQGSSQEKQWIYATALSMALAGKTVTVYTNTDGDTCRIDNIQVTSGLND